MQLTQFFPVPSDRMGVLWSLLSVAESIVLEYGPAGTTHFSMNFYSALGLQIHSRLFTTDMSDENLVLGDSRRLEKALSELDCLYRPRVIFVAASAAAEVSGVDISGICRAWQHKVQAKLIAVDTGGMKNDYSSGVKAACCLLAEQLLDADLECSADSYNLLGASAWRYRMGADIAEIQYLLKEALQLQQQACLCWDTSVTAIRKMGSAAVNIVVGNEGLEAARILQARFGTPYVYCPPYGYEGTIKLLQELAVLLSRRPDPSLWRRLHNKAAMAKSVGRAAVMRGRKNSCACIRGDYDFVRSMAVFLEQTGFSRIEKYCSHSLRALCEPDKDILFSAAESDWTAAAARLQKSFVLADDEFLALCNASNTSVRTSRPLIFGKEFAKHLPLIGERGADYMLEKISEYYSRL